MISGPQAPFQHSSGPLPIVPVQNVQNVRSTTKWLDNVTSVDMRIQTNEVMLNNLGPLDALLFGALVTVVPPTFRRLHTNDQVMLSIGVCNIPDVQSGARRAARCERRGRRVRGERDGVEVTVGIPDWTNDDASVATHEPPDWVRVSRCACIWCPADESIRYSQFDNAKFGIVVCCVYFVTWVLLTSSTPSGEVS